MYVRPSPVPKQAPMRNAPEAAMHFLALLGGASEFELICVIHMLYGYGYI